eukprot:CAMPEP_0185789542 /NCGR_PEP_ID=MMETSP1174-20130828/151599_1 /TAXON_ID=35687 /ORGANISM="Dictyocha speculum, Strain CCMP1381" /LENGTH=43 /DNA_ID= /DNA_START= /DNA_END= /DNA_ORIENTATION=
MPPKAAAILVSALMEYTDPFGIAIGRLCSSMRSPEMRQMSFEW